MARGEIKCINKRDRQSIHERISHVGGTAAGGGQWKWTEDKAIAEIEAGNWDFFVSQGGRQVDVIVAVREGRKYLKTKNDGENENNLLSLPECP